MDNMKAFVVCRQAMENSLYSSWISDLPCDVEIVNDCPIDWSPPANCGIVITHEHYRWEEINCLRRIYEQGRIPILVLADGIIEYRNTWQNPTIPDASLYQPLMAHKIACIGENSARMISTWGNHGKTEVVGLPRLDEFVENESQAVIDSDKFRLLVATATTPAFTEHQRQTVVESLQSAKQQFQSSPIVNGKSLLITWRVTDGMESEIGLERNDETLQPLSQVIQTHDAVITTPSTIFLECALLNRPTAILDFSNSPQYIQAAWTITGPQEIASVVQELESPPEPKLLFQTFSLHENLECRTLAKPRMIELVSKMVEHGIDCRNERVELSLPRQLLDGRCRSHELSQVPVLRRAFPSNQSFQLQDLARLQAELSQAVHRLSSTPRELAEKNVQISQLQAALDESRRRVADVRSRLFKLRKVLGIGKENQGEQLCD